MNEQYETHPPEATHSAMAASADQLLESVRADPPTAALERFVDPLQNLIKRDPELNQAFLDLNAELDSLRADDNIDMDTLRDRPERLLYRAAVPAAAPSFRVREAPYDYADKTGNASMTPNATRGVLPVVGKAGRLVQGSQGDMVGGTCWTGIAVTNQSVGTQPNQLVRITPFVKWFFFWDLLVAGVSDALLVGSNPWANCRVGARATVWDESGNNVTTAPSPDRDFFFRHHTDAPGLSVNKISGAEGAALVIDFPVIFRIPPGKTRWVNVDAYFALRTRYNSVANQAGAIGSYQVDVLSFVMRPE